MTIFRSILGGIICVSLPITGIGVGVANASGGDVVKPFKDSTSSNAVKRGTMTIEHGGIEQNLTESPSLSSRSLSFSTSKARCDIRTKQDMDLGKNNYRWHDDDVNSTFADPDFKGFKLQSARLCIKYKDVDFTSYHAYTPELDVVQFGDTTIGILPGNDGETLTKCWDVKSRLQKNTKPTIPFIINVDAAHDHNYWAVYLYNAVLSTCHTNATIGQPLPPGPGLPIIGPYTPGPYTATQ